MTLHAELIEHARAELAALNAPELAAAGVLPGEGRFLPIVRYPEIADYPETDAAALFAHEDDRPGIPYTAYLHVPFCASGCTYCHWVKWIDPPQDMVDDFIDTVTREMDLALARLGVERLRVSTVLFGGGTPTFLTPRQLERLLNEFGKRFDLSRCRQFSVEAEPHSLLGEVGQERLRVLRDFGVHRISLGIQSFIDDVLKMMGRIHSADEALRAIENIRKAGFDSATIDLIYAYPDMKIEDWIASMNTALAAGVDGWQLYRLRILQHGLVQGRIINQYTNDPMSFPTDERIYLMKMIGIMLSEQNGYDQHFTRIFTTDPRHSAHFMWDYCIYLSNVVGVGPSAWSNYHRTFTMNIGDDYKRYRALVHAGTLPVGYGMYRDDETEARRSFITPLKCDHVVKRRFRHRTGLDVDAHFGPELARLEKLGLITRDEKTVRLTQRGRFFADETVTQLFQKKYAPFPEIVHDLMPE